MKRPALSSDQFSPVGELATGVRIGHVNLRVSDLDRAIAFYRDVLGFTLRVDAREAGIQMALLAAGDYHHHIALNTWQSEGGSAPPVGTTGLHHVAILFPNRETLAAAVRRILAKSYPIDQAEDHGATVAVYLRDPDGNGLELYFDRPRSSWFDEKGRPVLQSRKISPDDVAWLRL